MARFDNAGMDGTHGHFVNFTAIHAKKLSVGGRVAVAFADGLEPRMALGFEAVLFPDFPFKHVGLRMFLGQRGVTSAKGSLVATARVLSASKAIIVTKRAEMPSGTPNQAHRRAPRSSSAAVLRTNSSAGQTGTSGHGRLVALANKANGVVGAHLDGKSCSTAAVQESRSAAGVQRPSQSESPRSRSGGRMTPAVSGKRLLTALAGERGRPSTIAKTTRVKPKNAKSRHARNISAAALCPV